jgi:hypothetical protein
MKLNLQENRNNKIKSAEEISKIHEDSKEIYSDINKKLSDVILF